MASYLITYVFIMSSRILPSCFMSWVSSPRTSYDIETFLSQLFLIIQSKSFNLHILLSSWCQQKVSVMNSINYICKFNTITIPTSFQHFTFLILCVLSVVTYPRELETSHSPCGLSTLSTTLGLTDLWQPIFIEQIKQAVSVPISITNVPCPHHCSLLLFLTHYLKIRWLLSTLWKGPYNYHSCPCKC